jgi:deoxyribonuclease-4
MSELLIGLHVSIGGGIDKSVDRAWQLGCTTFQIFTRNPRGWKYKPLEEMEIQLFREKMKSRGYKKVASHMPYLPNLASPNEEIYSKSVNSLINEYIRTGQLGIPYLVLHLGSHMGMGEEIGRRRIMEAINKVLELNEHNVMILLENTAGTRNSLGSRFEEIRILMDMIDDVRIGVCFDTAHAYSAGYDLRDEESVDKVVEEFDNVIGLKHLKVIHLNDTDVKLGGGRDHHEHIGLGEIGEEGFKAVINHPKFRLLPMIMETPVDERRDDLGNMMVVWRLAGVKPPKHIKI